MQSRDTALFDALKTAGDQFIAAYTLGAAVETNPVSRRWYEKQIHLAQDVITETPATDREAIRNTTDTLVEHVAGFAGVDAAFKRIVPAKEQLAQAITTTWLRPHHTTDQPMFTYLVGQPGSGKSLVIHGLRNTTPGIHIDGELLRRLLPTLDSERAYPVVEYLIKTLVTRVFTDKASAYMENTSVDSMIVRTNIAEAQRRGYRVYGEVMAVPAAVSQLNILARHLAARDAGLAETPLTSLDDHNKWYDAEINQVRTFQRLFERIRVWDATYTERWNGTDTKQAVAVLTQVRNEPIPAAIREQYELLRPRFVDIDGADEMIASVRDYFEDTVPAMV
ncbi:MAG: zeta toxin family protein [Corynebacterium sp.]|nr:zeta toxin family protein [Corynebacterium sp.]